MATKPKEDEQTGAEDIFAQLDKLEELKQKAINELLEQRRGIDEKLSKLGYQEQPATKKRAASTKDASERFCNICQVSGHDARAHRSQGDNKRPFTAEELAAL